MTISIPCKNITFNPNRNWIELSDCNNRVFYFSLQIYFKYPYNVLIRKYLIFSYPMVRYSDMDEAMKKEVMDVCTNACERHTANNELVKFLLQKSL